MASDLVRAEPQSVALEAFDAYVKAGDLAKLNPQQRSDLYSGICKSVGLNPLTRPFEFITLQGKLTLYAKKDCADQLRSINNVSLSEPSIEIKDGLIIVGIKATLPSGRTDHDYGTVFVGNEKGEKYGNAFLKAVTKAKRRVTLSICGLGFLDETEVDTIPGAKKFDVEVLPDQKPKLSPPPDIKTFGTFTRNLGAGLWGNIKGYEGAKARCIEIANLVGKPASKFTREDMVSYTYAIIEAWIRDVFPEECNPDAGMKLVRTFFEDVLAAEPNDLAQACHERLPEVYGGAPVGEDDVEDADFEEGDEV